MLVPVATWVLILKVLIIRLIHSYFFIFSNIYQNNNTMGSGFPHFPGATRVLFLKVLIIRLIHSYFFIFSNTYQNNNKMGSFHHISGQIPPSSGSSDWSN